MKKILLYSLIISMLFIGCVSSPSNKNESSEFMTEELIKNIFNYLNTRLKSGSRISLVNISENNIDYTDFILERLSSHMLNSNEYVIVARKELNPIKMEQQFQLSGDVSDETMASLGKILGAEYIVSCSVISGRNSNYLLISSVNVETSVIQAKQNFDIDPREVQIVQATNHATPLEQYNTVSEFISSTKMDGNRLYGFGNSSGFESLNIAEDRAIVSLVHQILRMLQDMVRDYSLSGGNARISPEIYNDTDIALFALNISRLVKVERRSKIMSDSSIMYCLSIERSEALKLIRDIIEKPIK
ncbi:MAG: CsgG/HfaB family protein [Treponema sp.]|nr:CsgG/HfaB family protein [Treponema sp.]